MKFGGLVYKVAVVGFVALIGCTPNAETYRAAADLCRESCEATGSTLVEVQFEFGLLGITTKCSCVTESVVDTE